MTTKKYHVTGYINAQLQVDNIIDAESETEAVVKVSMAVLEKHHVNIQDTHDGEVCAEIIGYQ